MSSLANKRLVIFGCGYVGSAVARAALAAGARVEALTRNPEKAAALRESGLAKVVVAELGSTAWHTQIAPAPDFVVNCVSSGGPDQYWQSYVVGMQSIVSWAAKSGPVGTMVYTSSTSVYPQGDGAVVDETAWAPGATPNGRTISESEVLLKTAPAGAAHRLRSNPQTPLMRCASCRRTAFAFKASWSAFSAATDAFSLRVNHLAERRRPAA